MKSFIASITVALPALYTEDCGGLLLKQNSHTFTFSLINDIVSDVKMFSSFQYIKTHLFTF